MTTEELSAYNASTLEEMERWVAQYPFDGCLIRSYFETLVAEVRRLRASLGEQLEWMKRTDATLNEVVRLRELVANSDFGRTWKRTEPASTNTMSCSGCSLCKPEAP